MVKGPAWLNGVWRLSSAHSQEPVVQPSQTESEPETCPREPGVVDFCSVWSQELLAHPYRAGALSTESLWLSHEGTRAALQCSHVLA